MGCISSTENKSLTETETKLSLTELKDVKPFSFDGISTVAKVLSVYDGDTLRLGFYFKDEIIQTSCRMLGYDSPEMKISKKNPNRDKLKQMAIKARDRFRELLKTENGLVNVVFSHNDLYGRPLVNIYCNEKHINTVMVSEGHGKPYDGGHKEEWVVDSPIQE